MFRWNVTQLLRLRARTPSQQHRHRTLRLWRLQFGLIHCMSSMGRRFSCSWPENCIRCNFDRPPIALNGITAEMHVHFDVTPITYSTLERMRVDCWTASHIFLSKWMPSFLKSHSSQTGGFVMLDFQFRELRKPNCKRSAKIQNTHYETASIHKKKIKKKKNCALQSSLNSNWALPRTVRAGREHGVSNWINQEESVRPIWVCAETLDQWTAQMTGLR